MPRLISSVSGQDINLVPASGRNVQINGANINTNKARSYSLVALAFSTSRTPSTTNDTLVVATVQIVADAGEDSTISFQVDDGGGFDTIATFRKALAALAVTNTDRGVITVLVPANSAYQIIESGTATSTITTINEVTL